MSAILLDLSPDRLSKAIEDNLSACIPLFSKLGEAKVDDPPGVTRAMTNIPIPMFNSIVKAQLDPGQVDAAIQVIIADARSHRVPVLWWVGPSTRPADLSDQLVRAGFTLVDDCPGMAASLEDLNEDLPVPIGVDIRPVTDEDSRRAWCRAMAEGFEIPPQLEFFEKGWYDLLRVTDPKTCIPYIAWMDGIPVATSLLLLGSGVAGIYAVATVPSARRQGIGAQVTLHPLRAARAKGYRAGVLEASEMGESVYRALGFRPYCRICSYRFHP